MAVAKNYCCATKAPGYSSLTQLSGSSLSSLHSSALPMLGDFPVTRQAAWDATLLLCTEGLYLPALSPGQLCPAPGHSGQRLCRWIRRVNTVSVLTSKSSVWDVNTPFSKQSPAGQCLVRKIHGGRGRTEIKGKISKNTVCKVEALASAPAQAAKAELTPTLQISTDTELAIYNLPSLGHWGG